MDNDPAEQDRITKSRIRKHLGAAQRLLEAALYELEQAEGCGEPPVPRRGIDDVLEGLSVRLLPDEG